MEKPRSDESRFLNALRSLWTTFLEGFAQRLDLFSLELEEEKQRLITVVVLSMVAAFAAFMGFLLLNLFVILLSWDSHREVVVLSMAGFYLAVTLGIALWLRQRSRTVPPPFHASLEEFRKDCAAISEDS